jgi:histidine ammonia-lyase
VPGQVAIDGASLTPSAVAAVARSGAWVVLDPGARDRMAASLAWVRRAAEGGVRNDAGEHLPIYGVNTGYGSLARSRIPLDRIAELSMNLVRSHAAGVGPALPAEAVRAMMLLRANALAKGASGCRPELVETIVEMLRRGVIPEVPSRGSCGSSGDLAPLSHLGLVVFDGPEGESGTAWFAGERLCGAVAMARAGIPRLVPGPKEGLAITNGAQLTTALATLAVVDTRALLVDAVVAAALSYEALRGVTRALHPAVHALRPFPGARAVAADLSRLLAGSERVDSIPDKVQDAYSLRCAPSVLGAVRDAYTYVAAQVGIEINAVTDNPVILLESDGPNKAFSAGLFHGEPIGLVADHLRLALCELGSIAERRVYRLSTANLSAAEPDLGRMLVQVTAASLVAESRQLAFPASVDSLPTCEDQEDHVAMSTTAARRLTEVVENTRRIVAIELLAAASALRAHPGAPAPATAAALARVERAADAPTPGAAIEAVAAALPEIRAAAEAVAGPLEVGRE